MLLLHFLCPGGCLLIGHLFRLLQRLSFLWNILHIWKLLRQNIACLVCRKFFLRDALELHLALGTYLREVLNIWLRSRRLRIGDLSGIGILNNYLPSGGLLPGDGLILNLKWLRNQDLRCKSLLPNLRLREFVHGRLKNLVGPGPDKLTGGPGLGQQLLEFINIHGGC